MNTNPMTQAISVTSPVTQVLSQDAEKDEQRDRERSGLFLRFFRTSLYFALLYTVCLYKNHCGITYPFFMAGTIFLTERLWKAQGGKINEEGTGKRAMHLFYIISLMLLSASKCTTMSTPLLVFDGLGIVVLMLFYLLHLFADNGTWNLSHYVKKLFFMAFTPIVRALRPLADVSAWLKTREKSTKSDNIIRKNLRPIMAGVLIATPLLLVVTGLLNEADVVFDTLTFRLWDALRIDDIPEFVSDVLRIGFTFICAYGVCYTVATRLGDGSASSLPEKKRQFPVATAVTVALPLCVVYLVFSLIQIIFLFIGKMQLPAGYTYAQYAHQGFYQLLFVSALNILLVLFGTTLFEKSKWLNGLLTLLSGCTYIMIASSALRMMMYIRAYQLTFLRVLVLWFLAVLTLLLTGVVVSVYKSTFPLFRFGVVTVTSLYLVFALARPDVHIARYNLTRTIAENGSAVSLQYDHYLCYGLSMDAVPVLAEYGVEYRQLDRYRYAKEENLFNQLRKFNTSGWIAEQYEK